jgi:hypothetical protein
LRNQAKSLGSADEDGWSSKLSAPRVPLEDRRYASIKALALWNIQGPRRAIAKPLYKNRKVRMKILYMRFIGPSITS